MDIFNLKGKSVVLTGARGYLGTNFCEALLEYGAEVHALDISEDYNDKIKQLISRFPDRFYNYVFDSTKRDELSKCRDEIVSRSNKVDVLINATTMKGDDFYLPFEKVSVEGWEIGLLGNLTATFLACQEFIPLMAKNKAGSVINIASIYGVVGNDQRIYKGSNLNQCYLEDGKVDEESLYSPCLSAAKGR